MPKIREIIENFVIDLIETIAISASIFVIVYFFAFQQHEVSGVSMNGNDGFHVLSLCCHCKAVYKF